MTSGENGLAVSQLLISLSRASEVSKFEQTATKERMILHVRPPERPPYPPTMSPRRRPVSIPRASDASGRSLLWR
jgi:hypothetical protein